MGNHITHANKTVGKENTHLTRELWLGILTSGPQTYGFPYDNISCEENLPTPTIIYARSLLSSGVLCVFL